MARGLARFRGGLMLALLVAPLGGCWLMGQGGEQHPGFGDPELPRFFPLRKDMSWAYEVKDGANQVVAHLRIEVAQVDQVGQAKTAVLVRVRDVERGASQVTKAGVRVAPDGATLWDLDGDVEAAERLIGLPLKPGSSWPLRRQGPTNRAGITGVEVQCTPMGAYADCLRIEQTTASATPGRRPARSIMWLAKDVGLVRYRDEAWDGSVQDAKLMSLRDPVDLVPAPKPCP